MKKLLLVLLFIVLLTGCTDSKEEPKEDIYTLTCEYDEGITIYTYTDDQFISAFIDGEESEDSEFWTTIIDESYDGSIIWFLEDMEEWYTSPFFETSSCVYE
jgi:hypothetical protein